MDITRKTSTTVPLTDGDQEDWNFEILQAMVLPSTAEDAAMACAASWLNFVGADRAAVVIFESTQSCIVAYGQREDSHLTIYVGREDASLGTLLSPEHLHGPDGPCDIAEPDLVFCWPEHLAAVLVCADEKKISESRLDTMQNISRRLLSRWSSPQTAFAEPSHMEAMAEFSAGAGHEINNPLGSIIGQTQLLLKREERADHRQALETIGAQAWRIRDMIGDAMLFARPPQPEFESCDIVALARNVVTALSNEYAASDVQVRFRAIESEVSIFADAAQLSTMIGHLVKNACQAVQEDNEAGAVEVEIRRDQQFAVRLTVSDDGDELVPEIRRHLFNPFFSGRQAGRGLGFGLCHCWQIARMHNGVLTHESLTSGNRFAVLLPTESSSTPSLTGD